MKIAVLFGGTSEERDVSIASASLLPAKAAGIDFPELLDRICRGAIKGR
jgi:D-alanine-D-alanine ligase-like ATP-grasp enzyme